MRKLAALTFLTLDGVMQSPSGPDEDPSDGFKHGGWARDCWDEVMQQVREEAMDEPYDVLCGRTTYDMFAENFPETGDTIEIERLNDATKYVVTNHPNTVSWKNSIPISGINLIAEVNRLKQQKGGLMQIHGSWNLIQQLLEHGLIDEFRLWTFPVIVGQGKKLFESHMALRKLSLVKTGTTKSGAVMTFYR